MALTSLDSVKYDKDNIDLCKVTYDEFGKQNAVVYIP